MPAKSGGATAAAGGVGRAGHVGAHGVHWQIFGMNPNPQPVQSIFTGTTYGGPGAVNLSFVKSTLPLSLVSQFRPGLAAGTTTPLPLNAKTARGWIKLKLGI